MLLNGFEVFGFIIGGMVLPHPPEHLQPALAQAAQGAGMVMAFVTFGLIIGLGTDLSGECGPFGTGSSQKTGIYRSSSL